MANPFTRLTPPLRSFEGIRKHVASLTDNDWIFEDQFFIHYLPQNLFVKDFWLVKLMREFQGIPKVFRMEPNRQYRWHVDKIRLVSINALLNNTRSLALFNAGTGTSPVLTHLSELVYEEGQAVLFNTQVQHTVINMEGTRDLFTVTIPPHTDYKKLLRYCEENEYVGKLNG